MAAATTASAVHCGLCGLPAENNRLTSRFAGHELTFCCHGCLHVYAILLESGTLAAGADPRDTDLYRRSLEAGLVSRPDSVEAAAPDVPNEPTELAECALQIDGMWCASCAWLIEHTLLRLPGVRSAEVLFASDVARIRYEPRMLPPSRLRERIERLGYRVGEHRPGAQRTNASGARDLDLRLGVAGFIWMNVMTLSSVIYVSYFEAIAESMAVYLPFVLMALTAPVIFYSAWPILRLAGIGLRHGVLRMEALLSLGILAAYVYSAAQAFSGGNTFYFDTACAIVTFVLIGKRLEAGAKERAARSVTLLHRMMPRKGRLLDDAGQERFVAVERLTRGVRFLVKAGEQIPVDGNIATGESLVDESVVTGESRPLARHAGDRVIGGSLNLSGPIAVEATQNGGEGTLARMIEAVDRAMASRAPVERTVDRVTRYFIPAVVLFAAATFGGWVYAGANPADALLHAISVLVIACPCALGIATPLAISSAVGAASRHGILINHASVWESAGRIDTVVFDKTGTITEGDFRLLDCLGAGESEVLARIAPLEALSEHPLGRTVVARANELGISFAPAAGLRRVDGMGIVGEVSGETVFAGSFRLAEHLGAAVPDDLFLAAGEWQRRGFHVIYAGWNGRTEAVLACGDKIRTDAAAAIAALRHRGVRTLVLSGDARSTTAAVCRLTGADGFEAEVLPEEKSDYLKILQDKGATAAMVGDGVNDAPALAQADLGIAMGNGAALAMQAAPVVLMTPALTRIDAVFDLAARTVATVRRNLFWAFFYNVGGITLAALGVLNPIWAAGAMILSSLSVILQSARLARWSPPRGNEPLP